MMIQEKISRYIWLLNLLQRFPSGLTLREIQEAWARHSDDGTTAYPRSTFNDHIREIQTIFEVDIICERKSGYRYRIEDIHSVNAYTRWLIDSLAVSSFMRKYDKIRDYVLIEDMPSSETYLIPILEAIRDKKRIEFQYHKYTDSPEKIKAVTMEPYLVKNNAQRWYVYGHHFETGERQTYALDRICALRQLEQSYAIPEDFAPEEVFQHSFGIMEDVNIKPEIVRIKANALQSLYFESLPLHRSQKIIEKTGSYTVFEYFIRPTDDFFKELMSYGSSLKVLSPASLAERLRNEHRKAAEE